jgi:hypothetical protein
MSGAAMTFRFVVSCLLPALIACTGCAATTVRSGRPPKDLAPGYDERWHSAFLAGVVPAGPPYDLAQICPNGWSQVTVARDPFTLLTSVLTLFIYSPSRVTIVCAIPGGPPLPPPDGYAPQQPLMPDTPGGP